MESNRLAAAFAALSQEIRVRLVQALAAEGTAGLPVKALRALVGIPASTLSFHLAALEQAGLVQGVRRGREVIYSIRPTGVRELGMFVAATFGDDALAPPPAPEVGPTGLTPSFNVLFLCTHNAARSIMAQAILEATGGAAFRAYSAGSAPLPRPDAAVLARLQALGHPVDHLRSKSWDEFTGRDAPRMDFVITLCAPPEGQTPPDFGDRAIAADWPLPDPARFTGSAVERGVLFDQIYDGIRRRLEKFCALPFAALDRVTAQARVDALAGAARA